MALTLTSFLIATVLLAAVCFVVGLSLGVYVADGYRSKRICRECRRSLARYGFNSDGVEYVCTRREPLRSSVAAQAKKAAAAGGGTHD